MTLAITPPDFLVDARPLCAEIGGDEFFPGKGEPTKHIRKVCDRCELQAPCLKWAMEHDEQGIWGGTTEKQRHRIKAGLGRRPPNPAYTWTDEATKTLIVDLTTRGWTTNEIARELDVSTRTVTRIRVQARIGGAA